MDRALTSVLGLVAWVKRPRWTPGLRTAALVGSVLFATYWTGSLIRGALAVGVLLTTYGVYRVVSWFVARRRLTLEAGLPVSAWRMVKDWLAERQRFAKVQDKWAAVCKKYPALHNAPLKRMQLTLAGDVKALVDMGSVVGDLDALLKLVPTVLPGAFRCGEVSVVQATKPGTAWITFQKSSPLERVVPIAELPPSGTGAISFGVHDDGSVASIPFGRSALVASTTGGGKSGFIYSGVTDIRRDNLPVELYAIDPKNAELSRFKDLVGKRIGNIRVMAYVRTGAEAKTLFERLTYEMHDRQQMLADLGLRDLVTPTDRFPARLVLADELMDVGEAFKGGATSPMGIFLSQGRATKDFMIAAAQQAKISTLGDCRDLYSVRAALRTMTPENTKAILGIGETEGALCSRIPLSLPGVGYYVTDEGIVRKFRTAHVKDVDVETLMSGGLPEGMLTQADLRGEPTWLYIGPDKCAKRTAYVGITDNLRRRFAQHRRLDLAWCDEHERVENWWVAHVDERRMETKLYPSRAAALAAEARAIRDLRPHFNIVHNSDNPLANVNLSRRAGWRRRAVDAGREWVEFGRDGRALRQVQAGFRKQERVAAEVDKRDRFVQRVEAEGWAA